MLKNNTSEKFFKFLGLFLINSVLPIISIIFSIGKSNFKETAFAAIIYFLFSNLTDLMLIFGQNPLAVAILTLIGFIIWFLSFCIILYCMEVLRNEGTATTIAVGLVSIFIFIVQRFIKK